MKTSIHHKYLRQLFLIYLNMFGIGLRPLQIFFTPTVLGPTLDSDSDV